MGGSLSSLECIKIERTGERGTCAEKIGNKLIYSFIIKRVDLQKVPMAGKNEEKKGAVGRSRAGEGPGALVVGGCKLL